VAAEIARTKVGISKRQAREYIRELEQLRFIAVDRGKPHYGSDSLAEARS
jgi:hypothetical protein